MIRKFTRYLFFIAMWVGAISCQDEEVTAPPKPTLQADKTSAEVGESVTFTINKVNADAVSVLPYGSGGDAGVLVKFPEGSATTTVTFSYARPGTFEAVAVANNHTGDGENVENVKSDPITITIFSSKSQISAFGFEDIDSEVAIDEDAKTITVEVPYGTDVENLTAEFTASPFSTVTVGGTQQSSGSTVNDFSAPVVYRVTANDGTTSDYTVTVNVTPVETTNTIASISAVAVSDDAEEKTLGVFVDNASRVIVIYDTLDTPSSQFDSVQISYELDGSFAKLKYDGEELEQEAVLDLTTMQEFTVYPQDSAINAANIVTYEVHAVAAPKLDLSFPGLIPDPTDEASYDNFDIAVNVLEGTDVSSINTLATTDDPAGVTSTITVIDQAYTPGNAIDYSEPVQFAVEVVDTNIGATYTVVYTVTVTVVP